MYRKLIKISEFEKINILEFFRIFKISVEYLRLLSNISDFFQVTFRYILANMDL